MRKLLNLPAVAFPTDCHCDSSDITCAGLRGPGLTLPHAAGVSDETQFILNTFAFSRLGRAGDVDVRRFHHAGSRISTHQETPQ